MPPSALPEVDEAPPLLGQTADGAGQIDRSRWAREAHARFFSGFADPHFNVVAEVELGPMLAAAEAAGRSPFLAMLWATSAAANRLHCLRLRFRGDAAVLHPVVHPSFTLRVEGERFRYCTAPFSPDFGDFCAGAEAAMAATRAAPALEIDAGGRDDLLFVSSLPWLRFTSVQHAAMDPRRDSFPRITWGRFCPEGGGVRAPLSLQGHHALLDGIHVAMFFAGVEALAAAPRWMTPPAPRPAPAGG